MPRAGKDVNAESAAALMAEPAPSRASWLRRSLHRFVPAGLHDPVGLTLRLLRSGDPAALFALRAAFLGPLVMPVDLLLYPFERARYRRAAPPSRPILFVCGCARSGTTVAAQLLMHRLPVSGFNNLSSVFPRSPLTAQALFGRLLSAGTPNLHNFYGRTSGWSGPNDALQLWDRWLGSDRTRIPNALTRSAQESMVAFFGAQEELAGQATLNKINSLNACAHLVAEVLPTARFICIERPRIELAMSLLKARMQIHGRADIAYGIAPPAAERHSDPIEDVCRQVLFHEAIARQQLARLGSGRFLIAGLDEISRHPDEFVERVARSYLGESPVKSEHKLQLDVRSPWLQPEQRRLAEQITKVFTRLDPRDS
jgi:hypothetical protein